MTPSSPAAIFPHSMANPRKILFPLFTGLAFAGSFVAARYATTTVPPFTLTLLRYLAAVLFLGCLAFHPKSPALKISRGDLPIFVILGLFGVIGYHFFFFVSLRYTTVANTAIINAFNPVVTAVLAAIFLRERLGRVNYAGVLAALVGVVVLISGGDVDRSLDQDLNWGDLLMLCAVVSWAVYALIVKTLVGKYSGLDITFFSALCAIPILCLLALTETPVQHLRHLNAAAIAAILYMGLIASGAGYLWYNLSIHEIGPTRTASVVYGIVPIAVAILAFFIFGEPITWVTVLSIGLIVAALRLVLVSTG